MIKRNKKKEFEFKPNLNSYGSECAVFSFKDIQEDYYNNKNKSFNKDHFIRLFNKLRILSQMIWKDINVLPRENGTEIIDRSNLKVGLPQFMTEDIRILSIRFGSVERMIGYKLDNIFYILYLDVNCSIYSH